MAAEAQSIRELAKKLSAAADSFEATGSEASRIETLDFARDVISALDKPEDALLRLTFMVKAHSQWRICTQEKARLTKTFMMFYSRHNSSA